MTTKIERRIKIKYRVRNKISGTNDRPRMSVFRSNKQVYVQLIDDLMYFVESSRENRRSILDGIFKKAG